MVYQEWIWYDFYELERGKNDQYLCPFACCVDDGEAYLPIIIVWKTIHFRCYIKHIEVDHYTNIHSKKPCSCFVTTTRQPQNEQWWSCLNVNKVTTIQGHGEGYRVYPGNMGDSDVMNKILTGTCLELCTFWCLTTFLHCDNQGLMPWTAGRFLFWVLQATNTMEGPP